MKNIGPTFDSAQMEQNAPDEYGLISPKGGIIETSRDKNQIQNKMETLNNLLTKYGYDAQGTGDYWVLPEVSLLNTTIITGLPNDGESADYTVTKLSLVEVSEWLPYGFKSYIGHESTAEIMSTLTGQKVTVNREQYTQYNNNFAICFKMRGRPKEGQILSKEEIEEIGYDWYLIERTK